MTVTISGKDSATGNTVSITLDAATVVKAVPSNNTSEWDLDCCDSSAVAVGKLKIVGGRPNDR